MTRLPVGTRYMEVLALDWFNCFPMYDIFSHITHEPSVLRACTESVSL